tara:strand:- start:48 stop:524 length:477 start_codon:yes stop_codon:yes gene_type:complete
MWIVVSTKNLNFFQEEIRKKVSDIKFYNPIIKSNNQLKTKNLLGGYLFCYSESFKSAKKTFFNLKFTKGLNKILFSHEFYQRDIISFINLCKSHEDNEGFIKNTFFKLKIKEKGQILNGPFSDYIFNLISKNNNNIKVIVDNIKLTISDKSKINYLTI